MTAAAATQEATPAAAAPQEATPAAATTQEATPAAAATQEAMTVAAASQEATPAPTAPSAPATSSALAGFAARRPGWALPGLTVELQLSSDDVLRSNQGRKPCPKCNRSRALYCYDCREPFTEIPAVHLPFSFSIITHQDESPSKNTGVQAAILAPLQIQLHSELELDSINRAFIIDSKWQKAKELVKHEALSGVRCVKLPANVRSSFWRFKTKGVGAEGVCTVEAMFYFLKALVAETKGVGAEGGCTVDTLYCFLKALVAESIMTKGVGAEGVPNVEAMYYFLKALVAESYKTQGVGAEGICTVEAMYYFLKALLAEVQFIPGLKAFSWLFPLVWSSLVFLTPQEHHDSGRGC
eukprot:gene19286-25930_t